VRISDIEVDGNILYYTRESRREENRKVKIILNKEVIEWLKCGQNKSIILNLSNREGVVERLENPRAFKNFILTLYAISKSQRPYKVAREYGISHEQLYRHYRNLEKEGLIEYLRNSLQDNC
jgi:hypothetical protein